MGEMVSGTISRTYCLWPSFTVLSFTRLAGAERAQSLCVSDSAVLYLKNIHMLLMPD